MRPATALILVGLFLVAIGAAWRWAPWLVNWFGNLPGDIHHRGERTRVFIPITSMLLMSIAASIVWSFLRRGGT